MLIRHRVAFVLIGGAATQSHGAIYDAPAIALAPEVGEPNLVRAAAMLAEKPDVFSGFSANMPIGERSQAARPIADRNTPSVSQYPPPHSSPYVARWRRALGPAKASSLQGKAPHAAAFLIDRSAPCSALLGIPRSTLL
ncbi:MAG TPA: hypothetical protein VGL51_04065 [Solirubrobacteraceae bacterium]